VESYVYHKTQALPRRPLPALYTGAVAMHTQLVEKGVVFKRHHLNYVWGRKLCASGAKFLVSFVNQITRREAKRPATCRAADLFPRKHFLATKLPTTHKKESKLNHGWGWGRNKDEDQSGDKQ
jgi:hypothetical protein